MTHWLRTIRRLRLDQAGQATVEWVLLLIVFGLLLVLPFHWLLRALVEHYRMITFLETLPFP